MTDKHRRLDQIAERRPEFGYTTEELDAEVAQVIRLLDGPPCPERTELEQIIKKMEN